MIFKWISKWNKLLKIHLIIFLIVEEKLFLTQNTTGIFPGFQNFSMLILKSVKSQNLLKLLQQKKKNFRY